MERTNFNFDLVTVNAASEGAAMYAGGLARLEYEAFMCRVDELQMEGYERREALIIAAKEF